MPPDSLYDPVRHFETTDVTRKPFTLCVFALCLCCHAGCTNIAALPTYPNVVPTDASHVLRQRASALQTLQADVDLELSQAPRQSVRLNAVMLAEPPDRLRLRAWKLGQPVFDLTLTPDRAFMQTGQKSPDRQPPPELAELARRLLPVLTGSLPPEAALVSTTPKSLIYSWQEPDGLTATATLDRATLTPTLYTLADAAIDRREPTVRFDLQLSHYRLDASGVVYPTQIFAAALGGAEAPGAERRSTIHLTLKDVAVNQPLPKSAFVPPRGAQQIKQRSQNPG